MRPCQVWGCLLHALSVVVTTSIFTKTQRLSCGTLWTSTHGLPTRYRQLFGMFGRSTYEKVTNPSMLLLLALGWYHTAHREILFGRSYRDKSIRDQHQNQIKWGCILISSETRVGWQSRDKEPINPEKKGGGQCFLVCHPRALPLKLILAFIRAA